MSVFHFKYFSLFQEFSAQKVGTDSMLLGAIAQWDNPKNLLDIGTGTGVLALMCAQRYPFEQIIGIELSEKACKDAIKNVKSSAFSSRIEIIQQDLGAYQTTQQFDAIISNPPFFENSLENESLESTQARHTSSLSFELLIESIQQLLSNQGKAWIIVPSDAEKRIHDLVQKNALGIENQIEIWGKPGKSVRYIFGITKRNNASLQKSSLCIRDEFGNYTDAYKALTREYHNRPL